MFALPLGGLSPDSQFDYSFILPIHSELRAHSTFGEWVQILLGPGDWPNPGGGSADIRYSSDPCRTCGSSRLLCYPTLVKWQDYTYPSHQGWPCLWSGIHWCVTFLSAGFSHVHILIALTVSIDSYFWEHWLWPEFFSTYFNVYEGKSAEWGVSTFLSS